MSSPSKHKPLLSCLPDKNNEESSVTRLSSGNDSSKPTHTYSSSAKMNCDSQNGTSENTVYDPKTDTDLFDDGNVTDHSERFDNNHMSDIPYNINNTENNNDENIDNNTGQDNNSTNSSEPSTNNTYAASAYPPQYILNANRYTIDMMTRGPGMDYFSFWFTISTYTPTILACLGPLANMISIAAIVDPWRLSIDGSVIIHDVPWVISVNIVSLVAGFSANILLILNFTGRIQYTFAQVGSILMWLCASITLSVDLLLVWKRNYFAGYHHSGGFYFGVFTCGIYFACFSLLLINYLGYLMKEYDETFNLDESQRGLMIHTVMLGVWIIVGAGLFCRLIGPMPYSLSVYFCSITILTIGLGDVVPKTNVSRALSLAFTFFGVLELGLVIAWLRQFVLSNIGPTLFWHRLEKSRKRLLNMLEEKNIVLDGKESFEAMTRLRVRCELKQRIFGLFYTLASYVLFWLMGALVFSKCEGWTYFEATYFCFLCLLTTGYGDFSPTTSIGRSFFVIWALAAIPMMTLLISSVGDALFSIATHLDDFVSSLTGLKEFYQENHPQSKKIRDILSRSNEGNIRRLSHQSGQRPRSNTLTAISSIISRDRGASTHSHSEIDDEDGLIQAANLANLKGIKYHQEALNVVQNLLNTTNETPDKVHNFQEWAEIYYLVGENPMQEMHFLGDDSPLRYPIKEAAYMLHKVMDDIQRRTELEAENQKPLEPAISTGSDAGRPADEFLEVEHRRSQIGHFQPASAVPDDD